MISGWRLSATTRKCCCFVPKTPILCSRLAVMDLCSRGRLSISALTVRLLNLLSASSVSQQLTEHFILNVDLPERPSRDRPRSLHDRSCPPRVIIPSTGRKARLTAASDSRALLERAHCNSYIERPTLPWQPCRRADREGCRRLSAFCELSHKRHLRLTIR